MGLDHQDAAGLDSIDDAHLIQQLDDVFDTGASADGVHGSCLAIG